MTQPAADDEYLDGDADSDHEYASGFRIKVRREEVTMTTRQVADLLGCGVKTIHSWVADGHIGHFRTPGRHLRFRAEDVAAFMRRSGFPVPPELSSRCPVLLLGSPAELSGLQLPVGAISLGNPLDALVACSSSRPLIVVVLAGVVRSADVPAFAAAISRACADARLVWVGPPPDQGALHFELREKLDDGVLAQLTRPRRRDRPIP